LDLFRGWVILRAIEDQAIMSKARSAAIAFAPRRSLSALSARRRHGWASSAATFRVLYWVIGVSFLGAVYLKTRVKGVRDGRYIFLVLWREPGSAPPRDRNQQGVHRLLRRSQTRATDRLAELRLFGDPPGGLGVRVILLAAISGLTQGS
jgi:hypothetical protein